MLCEKYKPALIEAAITGAELTPEMRSHVTACTLCAAELAHQRALIAAIDITLHRSMNAPLPPALLQRFEARLAQDSQPKPTSRFLRIFAGTLATLAVAATIVLMLPRQISKIHSARPADAKPAQKFEVDHMQLVNVPPPSHEAGMKPSRPDAPRHATAQLVRASMASTATPSQPEILVPPDDRIAFEHFIADFDRGAVLAATLAKRVPMQDLRVAPLEVPDIQTVSLTVVPVGGETQVVSNR